MSGVPRPLFLAYHFPPIGGAGGQRPVKLARCLRELGLSPAVVTGPGRANGRWAPLDETLERETLLDLETHRASGEPNSPTDSQDRNERWFWIRSSWSRWWIRESVAQMRTVEDADVIYTFMPPYVSAEAAAALSQSLGKPWIADLGDPWALDEMMVYPTSFHRGRELQRMRRLLGTASAIVTTTAEAATWIGAAFPELADRPIVAIPNGYDATDFTGPPPERSDVAFRIVHTGYLHTELGLSQRRMAPIRRVMGGGVEGAEILTRSHVYLLQAIELLRARDPDGASRIELHLAGVMSRADLEASAGSAFVRTHGYLSHPDAIALMRGADLLFLPMQNLPPGRRSGTVPGKTYDYLASQRPILAAVPDGEARDILLGAGNAHVCAPDDVEAMAEAIVGQLNGTSALGAPDLEFIARFDYRVLSARVAELIEEVLSRKNPARVPA